LAKELQVGLLAAPSLPGHVQPLLAGSARFRALRWPGRREIRDIHQLAPDDRPELDPEEVELLGIFVDALLLIGEADKPALLSRKSAQPGARTEHGLVAGPARTAGVADPARPDSCRGFRLERRHFLIGGIAGERHDAVERLLDRAGLIGHDISSR